MPNPAAQWHHISFQKTIWGHITTFFFYGWVNSLENEWPIGMVPPLYEVVVAALEAVVDDEM